MVWVYVIVRKVNTKVLIIFFWKNVLVPTAPYPCGYTHEKLRIFAITKYGHVDAKMDMKYGVSIRDGSPTQYRGPYEGFWEIFLGAPGTRSAG